MENGENNNPQAAAAEGAAENAGKKKKIKFDGFRKFFGDFKKFVSKGSVIDLAVAVVIGAAFGAIVTALVNDFIMPLISLIAGKEGLSALKWELIPAEPPDYPGVYLLWGDFLQKIIDFIIIAFFIFLALRFMMNAQKAIGKSQKKLLKSLKKNPELALNPPEELKQAAEAAQKAEEQKIESTDDILKDIRMLLTKLTELEQKDAGKDTGDNTNL